MCWVTTPVGSPSSDSTEGGGEIPGILSVFMALGEENPGIRLESRLVP